MLEFTPCYSLQTNQE